MSKRKENKKKNKTIIQHTQSYQPICSPTNLASAMATFWQIQCMGKDYLLCQVVKTPANAICTGLRSHDGNNRRQNEENIHKSSRFDISTSKLM
jgi:hypothetical protein